MTDEERRQKAAVAARRYRELHPDCCREYRRRVKAGQPRRVYTFRVREKADPQKRAKYYAANRERLVEQARQRSRVMGHLSWDERRAAGLVATKEQKLEQKREQSRLSRQRDPERARELEKIRREKTKASGYRRNRAWEKKRSLVEGVATSYLRSVGLIERGEAHTIQARRAALAYARKLGLL